jgi:hypothetical protein
MRLFFVFFVSVNEKDKICMAKKKQSVPEYGTVTRKGTLYYRTRITDADGKQVSLYATTCEELYEKQLEARRQVEEIIFRRKHPTVAEYCEKWLLMQSAKVSTATIKGYRQNMKNYVISSLGDMYMEEVTADDIRLTLVPLSQKSKGLYDTVNMLIKCVFYSAERSQLITDNPCVGISAKGGKASKKRDAAVFMPVCQAIDETVTNGFNVCIYKRRACRKKYRQHCSGGSRCRLSHLHTDAVF